MTARQASHSICYATRLLTHLRRARFARRVNRSFLVKVLRELCRQRQLLCDLQPSVEALEHLLRRRRSSWVFTERGKKIRVESAHHFARDDLGRFFDRAQMKAGLRLYPRRLPTRREAEQFLDEWMRKTKSFAFEFEWQMPFFWDADLQGADCILRLWKESPRRPSTRPR